MATTKTTTLTFRIDPGLKEALRTAAEHEHRSIANMVEVMIRDHCERAGISIIATLPLDAARSATSRIKSSKTKKTK